LVGKGNAQPPALLACNLLWNIRYVNRLDPNSDSKSECVIDVSSDGTQSVGIAERQQTVERERLRFNAGE